MSNQLNNLNFNEEFNFVNTEMGDDTGLPAQQAQQNLAQQQQFLQNQQQQQLTQNQQHQQQMMGTPQPLQQGMFPQGNQMFNVPQIQRAVPANGFGNGFMPMYPQFPVTQQANQGQMAFPSFAFGQPWQAPSIDFSTLGVNPVQAAPQQVHHSNPNFTPTATFDIPTIPSLPAGSPLNAYHIQAKQRQRGTPAPSRPQSDQSAQPAASVRGSKAPTPASSRPESRQGTSANTPNIKGPPQLPRQTSNSRISSVPQRRAKVQNTSAVATTPQQPFAPNQTEGGEEVATLTRYSCPHCSLDDFANGELMLHLHESHGLDIAHALFLTFMIHGLLHSGRANAGKAVLKHVLLYPNFASGRGNQ